MNVQYASMFIAINKPKKSTRLHVRRIGKETLYWPLLYFVKYQILTYYLPKGLCQGIFQLWWLPNPILSTKSNYLIVLNFNSLPQTSTARGLCRRRSQQIMIIYGHTPWQSVDSLAACAACLGETHSLRHNTFRKSPSNWRVSHHMQHSHSKATRN